MERAIKDDVKVAEARVAEARVAEAKVAEAKVAEAQQIVRYPTCVDVQLHY